MPPSCAGRFDRQKGDLGACTPCARKECKTPVRIKNDPRVTRVGWFLRRTSLDELPQLVNILQGKMSLVGPRPLQIRDCKKLATTDPVAHDHRLAVLPGLTGLAQVSGRRDLSFDSMIELDSQYAQSWSLALDIEILCRAVIVVMTGRGAY